MSCKSRHAHATLGSMQTRYSCSWSIVWILTCLTPSSSTSHWPKLMRFVVCLSYTTLIRISQFSAPLALQMFIFFYRLYHSSWATLYNVNFQIGNRLELACLARLLEIFPRQGSKKGIASIKLAIDATNVFCCNINPCNGPLQMLKNFVKLENSKGTSSKTHNLTVPSKKITTKKNARAYFLCVFKHKTYKITLLPSQSSSRSLEDVEYNGHGSYQETHPTQQQVGPFVNQIQNELLG